jgi:hypothetical protein
MRLFGLWLALTTVLLLAAPGTALATDAPTPDPAPAPTPAPAPALQPDPDPAAATEPPSSEPVTPPSDSQPAPSTPPAPAPPSSGPATRASTPQPAAPVEPEASSQRAKRRRPPERKGGARSTERQIATIDLPHPLPARLTKPLGGEAGDGRLSRAAIALLLLVVAGAASLRLTVRLAGPLAVVAIAVALTAPPANAVPPVLNYACSPAPADCLGWYRAPVTLSWDWNQLVANPVAGLCGKTSLSSDTKATTIFCEVADQVTFEATRHTVVIHIDRTPPSIAAVPDRPPDHAGWFNHPVSFRLEASDATSGVASCDSLSYGGPDGEGVLVGGGCRDVAGNVGTGSFALNYDATPPAAPKVDITPGHNLVDLDWSLAGGAVSVEAGPDDVLYSGAGPGVVDRGLRNGVRQRYRVTAIDRAGNRAADEATAVPTDSPLLVPARGAHLRRPPPLEWKGKKGASYYNVQLFRGRRKVLSRWPTATDLQLRRTWRFAGKRRRLVPGRYRWYVWPGFGKRAAREYGRLLGKSSFVITR